MPSRAKTTRRGALLLGCGFFAAFTLIQAYASSTIDSVYPFQAYRMFDANWKDGSGFVRVSYVDQSGRRHRPWDVMRVPFFQVNNVSFLMTEDKTPAEHKESLCQYVLRHNGFETLDIVYDEVYYKRTGRGGMAVQTKNEKIVYSCKTEKPA